MIGKDGCSIWKDKEGGKILVILEIFYFFTWVLVAWVLNLMVVKLYAFINFYYINYILFKRVRRENVC